MNQFKKANKKLEKQRSIFFQIGLIIAGGLTLVAFEWSSPIIISDLPDSHLIFEEDWDVALVIPDEKVEKTKVLIEIIPPVINNDQFDIVDDDIKDRDDKPIEVKAPLVFDDGDWNEPKPKVVTPSEQPFTIVEKMPEFIGGDRARVQFLRDNLKYPAVDKAGGIQGTVYLNFIVNKKGNIKKVKILRGVSPTLDKEAIRVVTAMPRWSPGKQRGKEVNVSYNFRIKFKLN